MRIGLDLDNTLICYDQAFLRVGKEEGILSASFAGNKAAVKRTKPARPKAAPKAATKTGAKPAASSRAGHLARHAKSWDDGDVRLTHPDRV